MNQPDPDLPSAPEEPAHRPDPPDGPPSLAEQERMIEALLFASSSPLDLDTIAARLPEGSDAQAALASLCQHYEDRGAVLKETEDGWSFTTAEDLRFLMHREVSDSRRLGQAALEVLAIIAYHQPVTRSEIVEMRGASVSRSTLDQLVEMNWIRAGQPRMTPGRPATWVVAQGFLDHFGLESARDLPGLAELRASGLLDDRKASGATGKPDPDSLDFGP